MTHHSWRSQLPTTKGKTMKKKDSTVFCLFTWQPEGMTYVKPFSFRHDCSVESVLWTIAIQCQTPRLSRFAHLRRSAFSRFIPTKASFEISVIAVGRTSSTRAAPNAFLLKLGKTFHNRICSVANLSPQTGFDRRSAKRYLVWTLIKRKYRVRKTFTGWCTQWNRCLFGSSNRPRTSS